MAHQTDASNSSLTTASTKRHYQVHRSDLPLSCPMPGQQLWNSHPRVYLPIEDSGEASCPYCSTRYSLVD